MSLAYKKMATLRLASSNSAFFTNERDGDVLLYATQGNESQRILMGNTSNATPVLTLEGATATVSGTMNAVEMRSPWLYSQEIRIGMDDPRITEFTASKGPATAEFLVLLEELRERISLLEQGGSTQIPPFLVLTSADVAALTDGQTVTQEDSFSMAAGITVSALYSASTKSVFFPDNCVMLAIPASPIPLNGGFAVAVGFTTTRFYPFLAEFLGSDGSWSHVYVKKRAGNQWGITLDTYADGNWNSNEYFESQSFDFPPQGFVHMAASVKFVSSTQLELDIYVDGVLSTTTTVSNATMVSRLMSSGMSRVWLNGDPNDSVSLAPNMMPGVTTIKYYKSFTEPLTVSSAAAAFAALNTP